MIRHGKIGDAAIALLVLSTFSLIFVKVASVEEEEDLEDYIEELKITESQLIEDLAKLRAEKQEIKIKIKKTEEDIRERRVIAFRLGL